MTANITDEDNEKTLQYKHALVTNKNFFHCENLKCNLDSLKLDIEKMIKF